MAMKLYVGGLAYGITDQQLQELFADQGEVASATVIKDRFTGQSKGFGFVEMTDIKAGQQAITAMNGKEIEGRTITVNEARPQEKRPSFGGGSRGGYGGGSRSPRGRY